MPGTTKISVSEYNSVAEIIEAVNEKLAALNENLLDYTEMRRLAQIELALIDLALALRRRTDLTAA